MDGSRKQCRSTAYCKHVNAVRSQPNKVPEPSPINNRSLIIMNSQILCTQYYMQMKKSNWHSIDRKKVRDLRNVSICFYTTFYLTCIFRAKKFFRILMKICP